MIPRILIKHLTGFKANQIEQFPLETTHELTIGRGPHAQITFDGQTGISRRHAMIKITSALPRLTFSIADLGSSNGTRLNGQPVHVEQPLLVGDIVELGVGGPTFKLAVEPQSLAWHAEPPPPLGLPPARQKHTIGRDLPATLAALLPCAPTPRLA